MLDRIEKLEAEAIAALSQAGDAKAVDAIKARYLGRQDGELNLLLRNIREVPAGERAATGARLNQAKLAIEGKLAEVTSRFGSESQAKALAAAAVDITLPGRRPQRGTIHPLTQTADEIIDVFVRMGFSVERGPEAESDFYNFEALNFPDHHPARDMQDTFFVAGGADRTPARIEHPNEPGKQVPILLRTHTSPV
jgi:phenylalanyl-tRNA synthetase alpha chain